MFFQIYTGDDHLAVFGRFQFRLVIIIKSNLLCACDLVFRTQLTGEYISYRLVISALYSPTNTLSTCVRFTPLISIEEPAGSHSRIVADQRISQLQ